MTLSSWCQNLPMLLPLNSTLVPSPFSSCFWDLQPSHLREHDSPLLQSHFAVEKDLGCAQINMRPTEVQLDPVWIYDRLSCLCVHPLVHVYMRQIKELKWQKKSDESEEWVNACKRHWLCCLMRNDENQLLWSSQTHTHSHTHAHKELCTSFSTVWLSDLQQPDSSALQGRLSEFLTYKGSVHY